MSTLSKLNTLTTDKNGLFENKIEQYQYFILISLDFSMNQMTHLTFKNRHNSSKNGVRLIFFLLSPLLLLLSIYVSHWNWPLIGTTITTVQSFGCLAHFEQFTKPNISPGSSKSYAHWSSVKKRITVVTNLPNGRLLL